MEGDPAETRQSVDIPLPICLVTISHAVEEKICACCRGEFPLPCQIRCQLWGERPCGGSLSGRGAACPFQAFTVLVERPLRYRTEPSISDILNRMKKRPSSAYGGDPEACGILPRRWSGRDGGGSGRRIALDVGFLKRGGHIHIPRSFPWKKCHVRTLSGRPPRQCAGFNMRLACHQLCLAHLVRHKEHILKLLRNPRVPSDNIPPNVPYRADRMFFNTTVLYQSKAMIF